MDWYCWCVDCVKVAGCVWIYLCGVGQLQAEELRRTLAPVVVVDSKVVPDADVLSAKDEEMPAAIPDTAAGVEDSIALHLTEEQKQLYREKVLRAKSGPRARREPECADSGCNHSH